MTPLDGGRDFAAKSSAVDAVRHAIRDADIVIAAERDSILTVWGAGRRLADPAAHLIYGMAPARSVLASL